MSRQGALAEYERQRRGWCNLLAITEDDAMALHEAACLHAGRELTADELRGFDKESMTTRRATLTVARIACIVGGALIFLILVLGENELAAHPDENQTLMVFLSVVLGGWAGEACWWWKVQR